MNQETPNTPATIPPSMRLLRHFLGFGCIGWLVSLLGVVLPWHVAVIALQGLGAGEIAYDPMLDYWMRMTAGAFTGIGILFGLAALNPRKYATLIPVLGWLSLLEGLLLAVNGLRLGLRPLPFLADTILCLVVGVGILLTSKTVKQRCPEDVRA